MTTLSGLTLPPEWAAHEHGLTMPPEWAAHEATLMAWPARRELWNAQLAAAKAEYAGVANAIAAFEPVVMVAGSPRDAAEARAALTAGVEVVELPIDDSWLRDSGPLFVVDDTARPRRRVGVHFGFNAWGEKFAGYARDAAVGGLLAARYGAVATAPLILEGGSVHVDGTGLLVTTEQCLLHPSRNPTLSREAIETRLRASLGVDRVVWLGQGLVEDRDTDGHVDLIATFVAANRLLLQVAPPGTPNHDNMVVNGERARAADIDVIDFAPLSYGHVVDDQDVVVSYLNLYLSDRFAIVPVGGRDAALDAQALAEIAAALPAQEVVGVPGVILAYGGGGPHCITQQVPALARG
jgi:agmatine deiminase